MSSAVANRYASALADVAGRVGEAGQPGDYRTVLGELDDFAAAYRSSAELRDSLETPALTMREKSRLLEALAARLAASPITLNFLRLLATNYRMAMLDQVVAAYRRISQARLGIVEVKISSAADLSEAERNALTARFRALTRHPVELEFRLDKNLLGGILAQIGSTVYDGSVRGRLERIGHQLVARR